MLFRFLNETDQETAQAHNTTCAAGQLRQIVGQSGGICVQAPRMKGALVFCDRIFSL